MRTLVEMLADTRLAPWDAVVMVGAGSGAWLPALRRLEADRLVLAEAQPELASALERAVDANRNERVMAAVVSDADAGAATLHVCNNPRFSGLATPTRLLDLLPNLRVSGTVQARTVSLESLAKELDLDPQRHNLLVLESPGQLAALRSTRGLSSFSDIVVHAGCEPLYEGDPTPDELHGLLREAGFEASAADPEDIYPFQRRAFRRSEALLESRALRESLAERDSELAAAREREAQAAEWKVALDEMGQRLVEIQAEAAAAHEANRQLEDERARIDREMKAATTERDGEIRKAREESGRAAESLAALQSELKLARAAIATQEARAAALAAQIRERDSELAASRQREAQDAQKWKDELDEAGKRLVEIGAEAAAARESHRQLEEDRARLARELEAAISERDSEIGKAREEGERGAESLAALQAELEHARAAVGVQETLAEALAGQVRQRDAELAASREREALEAAKWKSALDEAGKRLVEAEAQVAAARESHRQIEEERARIDRELKAAVAERDSEARKGQQGAEQLERLKGRLNDLDDQLINTRDAMRLAIRMQTLRENDLEEMRGRYARLQGTFQTQRELLKKLSERLVAANEYFQQLAGNGVLRGELVALAADDAPAAGAPGNERRR
jgi:chromosome segregation ATPase